MALRRAGVAKFAVSLILLFVLLWNTDRSKLLAIIGSLDPILFVAAGVFYLVAQALSTYRWQLLLRSEEISVPLGRLLLLYLEGAFFSLFLPTLIGGDFVRAHRVYLQTQRNEAAIASIPVERFGGLLALLAIAWGSLLANRDWVSAGPILAFSAALLVGLVVVFSRNAKLLARRLLGHPVFARVERGVTAFYLALGRYRGRRRVLAQVFVVSLIVQVSVICSHFLVARALGLSIPFVLFLALIPLVTIVAMLPVSVGGLGVRDGAVVYLFGRTGLPLADALGLSLGWFFVTVLCSFPGAIVFASRNLRRGLGSEVPERGG